MLKPITEDAPSFWKIVFRELQLDSWNLGAFLHNHLL